MSGHVAHLANPPIADMGTADRVHHLRLLFQAYPVTFVELRTLHAAEPDLS